MKICDELKLNPVVYGSIAYALYTKDKNIEIHDIDFLTPKKYFSEIIKKIKNNKDLYCEETNYNSLKIFKDETKITFDLIDEYYKNLPHDFKKIKINNILFTSPSLKSLKEIYNKGNITIPFKRKAYSMKLKKLNSLKS